MYGIIYDTTTGEIVKSVTMPRSMMVSQCGTNHAMLLVNAIIDDTRFYVEQGEVLARPTQTTTLNKTGMVADGVDSIVLTNVPNGTFTATNRLTKEAVTGAINETDSFSTTVPGTYDIKIESWPHLDLELTINAV